MKWTNGIDLRNAKDLKGDGKINKYQDDINPLGGGPKNHFEMSPDLKEITLDHAYGRSR